MLQYSAVTVSATKCAEKVDSALLERFDNRLWLEGVYDIFGLVYLQCQFIAIAVATLVSIAINSGFKFATVEILDILSSGALLVETMVCCSA
jgi:hypothetical protein